MGRYERMICYLYEYQDGHKGANVGYVKLEKRGEKCRVLIQMRRGMCIKRSKELFRKAARREQHSQSDRRC